MSLDVLTCSFTQVAQLQKKKKAAAAAANEKSTKDKVEDRDKQSKGDGDGDDDDDGPLPSPVKEEMEASDKVEGLVDQDQDRQPAVAGEEEVEEKSAAAHADEAAFNEAIKSATAHTTGLDALQSPASASPPPANDISSLATKSRHPGRQPSVSLQSKIRSTSFRDGGGPLSPGSLARMEELEKENKRLAREAEEHERRWRKVEEELEEVREKSAEENAKRSRASSTASAPEIARLRAEVDALKRQLRSGAVGAGSKAAKRESLPAAVGEDMEGLRKEIESKDSTIADMQLEISRLRSQLSSQTQGCETHGEQISALQASLSSAESRLRSVEGELSDTKKSLARASEKAVLDGTERTSKDTKIRTLERELHQVTEKREEVVLKAGQLEKKVEAMNKLHREAEARNATKLASAEATARDVPALRARIEKAERENARWREKHQRVMSGGGADDGLDELEDEERKNLEKRIRELEGQVFDLQRGLWRDKRVQMQPRGDDGSRTSLEVGEDFDEVDLSGSGHATSRRRSSANQSQGQGQMRHSNFTQVLNSGLAAFRTTTPPVSQSHMQTRARNDSLLEELDDDVAFDEDAFAQAQREEEARKMVEHVREVKRGLKQWVGWRLDLVDARRAGGGLGFGEIFDV